MKQLFALFALLAMLCGLTGAAYADEALLLRLRPPQRLPLPLLRLRLLPRLHQNAATRALTNKGDMAWMMTSTALVLMMSVPGLALFYAGMVRSKNTLSTLMQTFVIFCVVACFG